MCELCTVLYAFVALIDFNKMKYFTNIITRAQYTKYIIRCINYTSFGKYTICGM